MLCNDLRAKGYVVKDWGGGVNVGPPDQDLQLWLAPMRARVEQLHEQTGRKVALVGWSLGGIAARELSRMPGVPVDQVITLGTPFLDLGATNVGGVYKLLNEQPAQATVAFAAALAEEPPVRGASIFSKSDGIVSWEACLQQGARHTRNVEVPGSSHFGMVLCPKVLHAVLSELGA